MIGHVEDFIGGFVGQHQPTLEDGGSTCTNNGSIDRLRTGMIERRILREVDKTIEDDTVMRDISRLPMFNDDVVHPGCRGRTGETTEREGPVRIGEILIEQPFLCCTSTRHKGCIFNRREIRKHTDVRNRCAVDSVAKLTRHADGVGTVP